jgi:DNA-binding CsgD family transcriptional regulator
MTMTPLLRTRWSRVAAHLAAANRLRNRIHQPDDLAPETAEAILTPAGLIEHAHPGAQSSDARSRLAAGVRTVDRARGALRRTDPDLAVSEWKALIAARWTLVDHFESDGKRYVLARRNEAVESKGAPLTAREEQALGFASLGHTNKLIAYEMGISASTVSVLLYRAAKKFKTNSRAALIAAYLGESSAVIRKSHR